MHRRGPTGENEHSGMQLTQEYARTRSGQPLSQPMAGRRANWASGAPRRE
jgi:hypothetical protein